MNTQAKICVVLLGLLAGAGALMGEVYRVAMPSAGGDDGNSGLDWTLPKASISNALAQGDVTEVWVSNGAYTLGARISVTKAVTIRSWNNGEVDPDGTVIDGDNQNRCFDIRNADAVIDGFTITRGLVTGANVRGGGIYMTAGLVTNCLVISNTAHARSEGYGGGGVCLNDGGELWNCRIHENIVTNPPETTSYRQIGGGVLVVTSGKVVNCEFVNNQCYCANRGGGGVALFKGGYINNCTIISNYADNGGGICAVDFAVITNCRMTVNTSAMHGGGLYILYGKADGDIGVLLDDCLISNNTAASSGGGCSILYGTNHVMRNCRLVNNIAERDGGGMHANQGGLLMENCLVADNECHGANSGGGGVYAAAPETNMIMIRNVEIRGNKGSDSGAWGGGGAHLKNAWMENCVIENNSATTGAGGGIFASGTSTVINCHIISNQAASFGGGINAQGHYVIRNCLIAGNVGSNRFGGGIYANVNELGEISNCTIMDNEIQGDPAVQRGAGISVRNTNNIYNCLIWSNRWSGTSNDEERDIGMLTPGYGGDYVAQSNSVHYCCSPRDFGGIRGNITNPPSFVGAADGNWRLTGGSAGINAGTNMPWMLEPGAVDLDGRPRRDRFSRQVDMGCFEFVPAGVIFSVR